MLVQEQFIIPDHCKSYLTRLQDEAIEEERWFYDPFSPLNPAIVDFEVFHYVGNTGICVLKHLEHLPGSDRKRVMHFTPFSSSRYHKERTMLYSSLYCGALIELLKWNASLPEKEQFHTLTSSTNILMHNFREGLFKETTVYEAKAGSGPYGEAEMDYTLDAKKLYELIESNDPSVRVLLQINNRRFLPMLISGDIMVPSPALYVGSEGPEGDIYAC